MADPVLEIHGVSKAYGGRPVLEDIDLHIDAGEVVALLGPNGAGKTTLISIACGLRRADRGHVAVAGLDVRRRPVQARRALGLAPQELALYMTLDVEDNLRFFAELAGLRGAPLRGRVQEVAEQLGIAGLLDRRVNTLSGGEARRVHTAVAILARPPLILLDEPTVGADVQARGRILDVVRSLAAEGTAIGYTTHYLPEVEQLGARVAILHRGRIAAVGTAEDLVVAGAPAVVELEFEGRPPELDISEPWSVAERTLVVQSDEPTQTALRILEQCSAGGHQLRSLDVRRPSLEHVYLAITADGHRPPPVPAAP